jgi:cytochrome c553
MQSERPPHTFPGDRAESPAPSGLTPSAGLLTAALAGLLAVGLTSGCDEDENGNPICTTDAPPPAAPVGATPGPMDGGAAAPPAPHSSVPDAAIPILEVEGTRTLASLKADCDTRGGYMQVHAACAGANSCQGFSYHTGNPGTLTEHTCASANGCTGASCVVLPKERAVPRSGKQAYEDEDLPLGGPASCLNCHAVWGEKDAAGNYPPPDTTKFKLFVMPGSTRNASNWLQITAEEQEGIVAFGRVNAMPNGLSQVSMKPYHKLLSRGEIQRVVAHIRTLTPVVAEIKTPM